MHRSLQQKTKMSVPRDGSAGVKKSSLEESSQSSKKPGLMTSSDECFILKRALSPYCHHSLKTPIAPEAGLL